jgi:phosphotransferase system  glucose/maltose/N-acetylglucosamine-specific IIC component
MPVRDLMRVSLCGVNKVEKEHQCSGLMFFAALTVIFAVTIGINFSQVVRSRQDPPTSVSAGIDRHWQLPNMVSG